MCVIWPTCIGRCASEIPVMDAAPTSKILLTIFRSHDSKNNRFALSAILSYDTRAMCNFYEFRFKRCDR